MARWGYLSWIISLILLFFSVLAKKFVSDNITEQVMINGNHKRQYWNLNDTNESIGLNLTYLGSESAWQNKLPTMVQIFYRIGWLNWLRFESLGQQSLLGDLLEKLGKFTKWQLKQQVFNPGPFLVKLLSFAKRSPKSDCCTRDSNLSQLSHPIL